MKHCTSTYIFRFLCELEVYIWDSNPLYNNALLN